MKTRTQLYGQEATGLLRDITMYRVLTEEQIFRLHPGPREKIQNLLTYLTKQGRLRLCGEYYCAAAECAENIDRGLLAAVWVLTDFIDRVEYHSIGDFPTKVIFFADGEVYEVIHAAQGKETLVSHVLSDPGEHPSKYLVLVDEPAQIEELQIPGACGYCTVSPTGEVQYYQRE